jgi:hypothetical protein
MSVSDTPSSTRGTASASATATPNNGSLFHADVATTMATHVQLLSDAILGASPREWDRLAWVLRESCRTLGLRADLLATAEPGAGAGTIGGAAEWLNLERDEADHEEAARRLMRGAE